MNISQFLASIRLDVEDNDVTLIVSDYSLELSAIVEELYFFDAALDALEPLFLEFILFNPPAKVEGDASIAPTEQHVARLVQHFRIVGEG